MQHDELQVKYEQVDGAERDWPTSAKTTIDKIRGLLPQARDTILQVRRDHEEQLAAEKRRNDSLKVQELISRVRW